MADQFNIGVRFGGDVDQLRAASAQAAAALTSIKNAAGAIPPALSQIGPAANKAAAGVERLKAGLGDAAGGSLAGIGQGAQSAIRSIDSLEAEIDQLEAAIRKSTDPSHINRLSKSVADLQRQINNIKVVGFETSINNITKGSGAAAAALAKIKKPTSAATGSLTDFSRVLQDLPFGMTGIINNLQQLPESLNRLKTAAKESGQSVGSLLLQSVKGFGGIGLAISAITSGFLIYQNGITGFFKGASNGAKEAKEAADEYESSLKAVSSQIAQEATRVALLVNALQGETLTRKEKAAALKELSSINEEYFGQLKQEEGFVKKLNLAYVAYLANLKNQFAAKALEKQIDKLFDKRLTLETELDAVKFSPETNLELGKIENRIKELQKVTKGRPVDLFNLTAEQKELGNLNQQLVALQQTNFQFGTKGVRDQIAQVDRDINALITRAEQIQKVTVKPPPDPSGDKQDAILKRLKDELQGLQKQLEVTNKLREAGILPINRENDALELQLAILNKLNAIDAREVAIKIKPALEIDPVLNELEVQKAFNEAGLRLSSRVRVPLIVEPDIKIDVAAATGLQQINIDAEAINKKLKLTNADKLGDSLVEQITQALRKKFGVLKAEVEKVLVDFNVAINQVLKQGLVDTFAGVGESIGNALSGGFDLEGILKPMANAISNLLINMGKLAIETGVEILAIKKAFIAAVKNPAILIAGGIALVAIGAALKNKFNKQEVPGFADGVTNFGGGLAVVGERGPELVNLPRGADVIPNHFLNGQQPVLLQPSINFSGDQFRFMLNKVDARKRRI